MNLVWFKRDLRIQDHNPLNFVIEDFKNNETPYGLFYLFEPMMMNHYDFSWRHWRFVYQSLLCLKAQGVPIYFFWGEARAFFQAISESFLNFTLLSHQEIGVEVTFKRDQEVKKFIQNKKMKWREFAVGGVIRGKKNRQGWDAHWIKTMSQPPLNLEVTFDDCELFREFYFKHEEFHLPQELQHKLSEFAPGQALGGELIAKEKLQFFLNNKLSFYWGSLSYPEKSRYWASHLSAYLAWGNLSTRQIFQECLKFKKSISPKDYRQKKALDQFMARLKWRCHFMQKFESECSLEFENLNKAFDQIRIKKEKKKIKAWKEGMTGYPLVDAAMRSVSATGFLNFRLRAMVVSYLTHHLWQPWQEGAGFLARQFLDYEPGIHFSQFQMQAATTGINTIRIYNPIKQSQEKDPHGEFIKRWVPELRPLPDTFIHCPWEMSLMDQMLYGVIIGEHYPRPLVDVYDTAKQARETLWAMKRSTSAKTNSLKIFHRHTRQGKSFKGKK